MVSPRQSPSPRLLAFEDDAAARADLDGRAGYEDAPGRQPGA